MTRYPRDQQGTRLSRPIPAQNQPRGPTEPPACHFPHNPACTGLRPDLSTVCPSPSDPGSLPRRGRPTDCPRVSSGGCSGRLRPSFRAHNPAATGTASYSPDIRNTPPPGLPGACLPRPFGASRRSSTAGCSSSDSGLGGAGLRRDEAILWAGPIWPRLLPFGEPDARDVAASRPEGGGCIL